VGMTLLEVLLAGLILTLAVIPLIDLLASSSTELHKVRDRLIAINLASSMTEEMRSRTPTAQSDEGPVPAGSLAHLAPIVEAHKALCPGSTSKVNQLLGKFRCTATAGGSSGSSTVRADVSWTEAGVTRIYSRTAQLSREP
jgi:Tfp pilus assembly protein PilV